MIQQHVEISSVVTVQEELREFLEMADEQMFEEEDEAIEGELTEATSSSGAGRSSRVNRRGVKTRRKTKKI